MEEARAGGGWVEVGVVVVVEVGWLVGAGGIIRPATREGPFFVCRCRCGVHYKNRHSRTRGEGRWGRGCGGGGLEGVIGHRLDKGDSQSTHASDIMRAGSLCG